MPRFRKRTPGSRRYLDYDENTLKLAVESVKKGMSKRKAPAEFGISRSTLTRRLLTAQPNKPGRPPVLTMAEENVIVERIQLMCEWGFPMDGTDLRYLVNNFLDRKGVKEKRFKDNMPSTEFVYHFKKHHPALTE